MKNILKNIFSISDYGETHHLLRIFGLKIKFPKREFEQKRKENPYYYYKKNNIDITTIPPATGQIRDIQLANLAILKELDYVCRQNGLKYWLDGGTLLGAIRHKGFVPWDDDIDVSMMREEYDKLIETFNKATRNPDLYADYVYLGKSQTIIKIMHKKCSLLFVDIFPCDYTYCADETERNNLNNKLKSFRQKLSKNRSLNTVEKVNLEVSRFNEENLKKDNEHYPDIACGMEYKYIRPVLVQPYDVIFPIKETTFEGNQLMCVNKQEEYMSGIYKNYMAYPSKIGFGHNAYVKLSEDEKNVIKELGEGK